MHPDLDQLRKLVVRTAQEELLPRYRSASPRTKADGSIVTAADLAAQRQMRALLGSTFPGYGFLGEEMSDAQRRRQWADAETGLWVLDPLDGTSNFAAGIPFFAISLALLVDREVHLGLVYDPIRRECFSAAKGHGAYLNGRPLQARASGRDLSGAIALVDHKRLPPDLATRLACSPPFASHRNFGAVALELCWLAAERGQVYLHGRHHLWDYAAGLLILHEAGGRSLSLEGIEPLPSTEPRSTAAALDPGLFRQWCDWLGLLPPEGD